MNALVEIVRDEPVPIVDGYVTINLPQFSLSIRQAVKQIKGRGTHDAIRLEGQHPDAEHQTIIKVMLMNNEGDLTAEEIRLKARKHLYFQDDILYRKFEKQTWFQRKHSELLYWKVLTKTGLRLGVPIYQISVYKGTLLKNGGVFT